METDEVIKLVDNIYKVRYYNITFKHFKKNVVRAYTEMYTFDGMRNCIEN